MLRTFHVCWKTSLSKLPAVVAVVAGVTGVAEAVVEKDNRLRTITARVQVLATRTTTTIKTTNDKSGNEGRLSCDCA